MPSLSGPLVFILLYKSLSECASCGWEQQVSVRFDKSEAFTDYEVIEFDVRMVNHDYEKCCCAKRTPTYM